MLSIANRFQFETDYSHRGTALYFCKVSSASNGKWSVELSFKEGSYKDETIAPSLCINWIETKAFDITQLAGSGYETDSVEICDRREDTFCLYEHEPMSDYVIKVLEVKDNRAHINIRGHLIVDGYATPYQCESFAIDEWVWIIENKEDWKKFE